MVESNRSASKNRLPLPPTTGHWSPNEPNTVLRVLCYRSDETATKFLKKTYNLPKKIWFGSGDRSHTVCTFSAITIKTFTQGYLSSSQADVPRTEDAPHCRSCTERAPDRLQRGSLVLWCWGTLLFFFNGSCHWYVTYSSICSLYYICLPNPVLLLTWCSCILIHSSL